MAGEKNDTVSKSTAIIIICGVCVLLSVVVIILAVTGTFAKIGNAFSGENAVAEESDEDSDNEKKLRKADLFKYIGATEDEIADTFFDGDLGKQDTFGFENGKVTSVCIKGKDRYRFCGVNLKSDPHSLKGKFEETYEYKSSEENNQDNTTCLYYYGEGRVEIVYETENGKINEIRWFDSADEPQTDESQVTEPSPDIEADNTNSGFSDSELCDLAADYYEALNGQEPPFVMVDSRNGNEVVIHLYEFITDHTCSWDWYTVDARTGVGTDVMGSKIDLLNPPDRSWGDIDEAYYAKLDLTDPDVMIFPDADLRYIDEYELKDMTAYTCRIARNEIYARHGRVFKDKELQEYFNSKSWYYPDKNANIKLNKYETENVATIQKYEKAMGYQ